MIVFKTLFLSLVDRFWVGFGSILEVIFDQNPLLEAHLIKEVDLKKNIEKPMVFDRFWSSRGILNRSNWRPEPVCFLIDFSYRIWIDLGSLLVHFWFTFGAKVTPKGSTQTGPPGYLFWVVLLQATFGSHFCMILASCWDLFWSKIDCCYIELYNICIM